MVARGVRLNLSQFLLQTGFVSFFSLPTVSSCISRSAICLLSRSRSAVSALTWFSLRFIAAGIWTAVAVAQPYLSGVRVLLQEIAF